MPSQNRATATLSTEESFLRPQYIEFFYHISSEVWEDGSKKMVTAMVTAIFIDSPSWGLSSQPDLDTIK
jgi:hypothetical protein